MNNSNEANAPAWVVACLRRKLRNALREQDELRARLAVRARQVVELNLEKSQAERVSEFWKKQANEYFEGQIATHRTIGGLRYLLEQAGGTIPEHLK